MVNLADTLMLNAVTDGAMNLLRQIGVFKSKSISAPPAPIIVKMPLWELAQETGPWVRLAGLSGATAVVLGAMGAHRTFPETDTKEDLRKIFETANRFHFLHTLALVTVPLCRRPVVAGAFFLAGMGLFCGTCYYHAFTGDRSFRRLTPIGGSCLILGWIAMVL
ncbi:transmembrane protein 256 homolog isoform X1 [Pectinophora gossypiella]|uniref:transmembrane protein 256 homolog isoform X1 n=2 Tax=Pectinophora gossypiella TaxID=13191 RepID=UPI00214F088D|nr:transmembrane protein 256 homolog isoform X1 [Pectinophora gossypiella]